MSNVRSETIGGCQHLCKVRTMLQIKELGIVNMQQQDVVALVDTPKIEAPFCDLPMIAVMQALSGLFLGRVKGTVFAEKFSEDGKALGEVDTEIIDKLIGDLRMNTNDIMRAGTMFEPDFGLLERYYSPISPDLVPDPSLLVPLPSWDEYRELTERVRNIVRARNNGSVFNPIFSVIRSITGDKDRDDVLLWHRITRSSNIAMLLGLAPFGALEGFAAGFENEYIRPWNGVYDLVVDASVTFFNSDKGSKVHRGITDLIQQRKLEKISRAPFYGTVTFGLRPHGQHRFAINEAGLLVENDASYVKSQDGRPFAITFHILFL